MDMTHEFWTPEHMSELTEALIDKYTMRSQAHKRLTQAFLGLILSDSEKQMSLAVGGGAAGGDTDEYYHEGEEEKTDSNQDEHSPRQRQARCQTYFDIFVHQVFFDNVFEKGEAALKADVQI